MNHPRTAFAGLAGTALLLASTLGGAAQSPATPPDPTAPAPFTGRITPGPEITAGTTTTVDGRAEYRGGAWNPIVLEMTDPRLDGKATFSNNNDSYTGAGGVAYEIGTSTWRIETDEGAWQGSYHSTYWEGLVPFGQTVVLVGEGAYDGLVAIWEQATATGEWVIQGVILPGDPPEAPAAP